MPQRRSNEDEQGKEKSSGHEEKVVDVQVVKRISFNGKPQATVSALTVASGLPLNDRVGSMPSKILHLPRSCHLSQVRFMGRCRGWTSIAKTSSVAI